MDLIPRSRQGVEVMVFSCAMGTMGSCTGGKAATAQSWPRAFM